MQRLVSTGVSRETIASTDGRALQTAASRTEQGDEAPAQARRRGRPPKSAGGGLAPGGQAHLVTFRETAAEHSVACWAAKYLAEEVYGLQSPNTLDAKSRDLTAFVRWLFGAGGGSLEAWLPRDTQLYLDQLKREGRAPATINRAFATLRRFARWAHEQPGALFGAAGIPTRGVKELEVAEADCQKLDKDEVRRMFAAADQQVAACDRKNQRPRRNRAILAVLYYSELRVSEIVALRRGQYDGRYLLNVRRKGKARSREIYVSAECRRLLDDYLLSERPRDAVADGSGALFAGNASTKR